MTASFVKQIQVSRFRSRAARETQGCGIVYSETDKRAKAHITNSVVQSTKDHFFSFSQLNNELKKELGFSDDFMDKAREYIKKVTVFVFNTARVQPQPLGKTMQ